MDLWETHHGGARDPPDQGPRRRTGIVHFGIRDENGDWHQVGDMRLEEIKPGVWEALLPPYVNDAFTFIWDLPYPHPEVDWEGKPKCFYCSYRIMTVAQLHELRRPLLGRYEWLVKQLATAPAGQWPAYEKEFSFMGTEIALASGGLGLAGENTLPWRSPELQPWLVTPELRTVWEMWEARRRTWAEKCAGSWNMSIEEFLARALYVIRTLQWLTIVYLMEFEGRRRLHHLHRAAGEPERHPHERAGARPVDEVVVVVTRNPLSASWSRAR